MNDNILIRITGEVDQPLNLTFDDLQAIDAQHKIDEVESITGKYKGAAIKLTGLLELCGARPAATHIGLHASTDDFHASIPLSAVRDRAFVIYSHEDAPLDLKNGGPGRFYIPDHAACKMDEVDECANVKFLDWIELTIGKGHDNRPEDEDSHRKLHEEQGH